MRFRCPRLPEALGKGVVVNLELGDLLVLVCSDSNKLSLPEDVGPEGGVGQLHDVAGPDQVEAGLVLVHRVQDGLQGKRKANKHWVIIYAPLECTGSCNTRCGVIVFSLSLSPSESSNVPVATSAPSLRSMSATTKATSGVSVCLPFSDYSPPLPPRKSLVAHPLRPNPAPTLKPGRSSEKMWMVRFGQLSSLATTTCFEMKPPPPPLRPWEPYL